jgi:uncharacterized integral membrane protein
MKAFRLILSGALLALFILFAFNNWVPVPVVLPNGSKVSVFLPIIVLISFVLGWLPMLLVHLVARSSWQRRSAKVDRLLDDALSTGPRVAAQPTPSSFPPAA